MPSPTSRPTFEAIELELFTHRFSSIALEMGEMLQRTALSTNVRERLDFSCALLDREGRLVVNAPHIPVHLGAMGLCVRRLKEEVDMHPGDSWVTNHPGYGGSHLPDVTLVTPVHDGNDVLIGYVASRSHHAEIGGARPGSMPPDATRLAEEGVVIPPTLFARAGGIRRDALRSLLSGGAHPSRSVDENLADLDAALAASARGASALADLAKTFGTDQVAYYMDQLRALASRRALSALQSLPEGASSLQATQFLDDGTKIQVSLDLSSDRPRIDFTGSDSVHPGNLNATPAIVRSVVLYVLRWLVQEDLPLNEGLLEPVDLVIPEGSFLSPVWDADPWLCPAVVGGNVETSQRLVDTLLQALGLQACSQGTMNNLLFGDETFGYYETICGGAGAGPTFEGESAVHTHMTNTRITDPEVLERRYPVRLDRFGVRHGSGGEGHFRGGDGVVRELVFERDAQVSILSQHRIEAPFGMAGGGDGATGKQRIVRAGGTIEHLDGMARADVRPGDRLVIETPGGGGWGKVPESLPKDE